MVTPSSNVFGGDRGWCVAAYLGTGLCALLLAPLVPCVAQLGLHGQAAFKRLPEKRPNILVIIADDIGVDIPAAYGEHPDPAHTPRIDALAAEGVLFRNAWSNPVCSPTRATLLTGRYSVSTGIGEPVDPTDTFELQLSQPSIPRSLGTLYRKAAVGKWHLSTVNGTDALHPLLMGFDHHLGPMQIVASYENYDKAVDGVHTTSTTYATTEQVDDALELISAFKEPWFLWLAFTASHSPLHPPPPPLHTYTLPPMVSDDPPLFFRAVTEAMDTEIGRLLDSIPREVLDNTYVIFLGDNGTPPHVTTPPFDPDHAKWTVYEGGVNVPLIVTGPGVVRGAECAALVHTVDLFATVADITGVPLPDLSDSVSMFPYFEEPDRPSIRPWVFAETFAPNGIGGQPRRDATARDVAGRKVILRYTDGPDPTQREFYDLVADPFETTDLLQADLSSEHQMAYDALVATIEGILTN